MEHRSVLEKNEALSAVRALVFQRSLCQVKQGINRQAPCGLTHVCGKGDLMEGGNRTVVMRGRKSTEEGKMGEGLISGHHDRVRY